MSRDFDQNELTKTIVAALKRTIRSLTATNHLCQSMLIKAEIQGYIDLVERIEREHMDLRMSSRLE